MKIVCVELNLVRVSRFFAVFGMNRLKLIFDFLARVLFACSAIRMPRSMNPIHGYKSSTLWF